MIQSIMSAIKIYTKRPMPFAMLSLYYAILQLMVFFAFFGVFVLLFMFATLFNLTINIPILALIAVIPVVVLLYFSAALYGSYIKHCNTLLEGANKTDIYDFFRYSMQDAGTFFRLIIAKILLVLLLVLPLIAVRLFVLVNYAIPYVDIIIAVIAIGIDFIISFIFSFSFFFAALYEQPVRSALGSSLRVIKKKHIFAFVFYALYAVIMLTLFIPVINLITIFVTMPILVAAVIIFCQKAAGMEMHIQEPAEEKPQDKKQSKKKK